MLQRCRIEKAQRDLYETVTLIRAKNFEMHLKNSKRDLKSLKYLEMIEKVPKDDRINT